jgi:FSR family fosmidomycin resistance protein-like MFS transporter
MAAEARIDRKPATDWNLSGLFAVAFGHGVNDLFSGTVALTIFYVVASAHLAAWYQGAIGFLWYLTSSIVQPLFGAYSDRHGRWWFMPSGILLVVLAVSAATFAPNPWVLGLLITVGGFGSAVMHPEAGKYAALLSGPRRSRGISIFQIGGSMGFSFGPLIIASLLSRFGAHGSLVLLAPGLLACAYIYAGIYRAHKLATLAHAERKKTQAADVQVDRLGIALVVASTTMRFLTTMAFVTYLPNLLTDRGGTLVEAGQVVTAFLLLGNVGNYVGGMLSDRFGAVAVSAASLCCAVPCLLGFFYLPLPYALAVLMLGNVMLAMQNSPGVVIVQSMLPKNLGMALGLINGVAFGAGSALVAVVGVVVTRLGPETALYEVAFVPFVAASAYLVLKRRLPLPQRAQ